MEFTPKQEKYLFLYLVMFKNPTFPPRSSRWHAWFFPHTLPCSTFSMTFSAFLAAHPPMDTWSSVAALVERESTEEGWHKALFSETAKVQYE